MTKFRDVIDRATTLWVDYRLDKLHQEDEDTYYILMEGFLLNSIDLFDGCLESLDYEEITETVGTETITQNAFVNDLSSKIIYILALGVAISWMENNTKDITQMNLHLSSQNFKSFSESNNLKEKESAILNMREEYDRNVTQYQLKNLSSLTFFGGE